MMKNKIILPIIAILCIGFNGGLLAQNESAGQDRDRQLVLRKGNIGAALPFVGISDVLTEIYRPYMEVGYALKLNRAEKNHFWLEGRVGYFNHRFVQQVIPIMLEGSYERNIKENIRVFAGLGLGYLHAFPHEGRFELNEQGEYERVGGLGRAQFGANMSLGARYILSDTWSISGSYRALLQMPFVNTYVPLLPYGIVQLGLHYTL
jgi:hypothetical protein